jgi:tetratricopeptide (TPR) repeat protein
MKTILCSIFTLLLHAVLHSQTEPKPSVLTPPPALTIENSYTFVDSSKYARTLEVFEMGNLLTAMGKHEDAYQYFLYVLNDFNTKVIRNNAGLSAVLEALYYFRPNEPEVKFRYPLELDLQSAAAKGTSDFKEKRAGLLRQAIAHFDTAIGLDSRYAPAYLNKACAFALLGDMPQAQTSLLKAQGIANQAEYAKTLTDLQILLGILYERQGDTAKAQAAFQSAAAQGNALGAYNLRVLLGQPDTIVQKPLLLGGTEKLDNWTLTSYYETPEIDLNSEIDLGEQFKFYHNLHPGPNSRFYFNFNAATDQKTYLLLTIPNYTGQTARKLHIGASSADIDAAYGTPKRTLETSGGQIRLYPSIILILGKEGSLKQWAVYGEDR